MSDLISRDNLSKYKEKLGHNEPIEVDAYYDGWNNAIDCIIKNEPSAYQWVPVTERLPDNNKGVLVTRKTIIGNHRVVDIAYYFEIMNTWVAGNSYTITVDAWMPLPESWEETKERKKHCE